MQITVASVRVLRQIYALHRHDVLVSPPALAAMLAEEVTAVDGWLGELVDAGLLQSADRPRLTFTGLALAAATSPRTLSQKPSEAAPVVAPPLGPRLSVCPVVKAQPRGAQRRRRPRPAPQKQMPRKQILLRQSELFEHV
jgi:hypothetical protein